MLQAHRLEWEVPVLHEPMPLKHFLKNEKDISSRLLKQIKKAGEVRVNGDVQPLYALVYGEEAVTVFLPTTSFPQNIPLCPRPLAICWEDEHLLVVNKEAGVPMFPGRGLETITLAGTVKHYYKTRHIDASFHAVSRLDKQTSGLVPIAKHPYAHQRLARFFQEKKGHKTYIGATEGRWNVKEGIIDAPIARKRDSLIEHEVTPLGKHAITRYNVQEEKGDYSIVQFELLTGRTHQIRVHTSYSTHPLLGDDLYGGSKKYINRQALHAYRLTFIHPIFETKHTVQAELPEDIACL